MKDYVLKDKGEPASNDKFLNGLVFGFDVGTGSIGYAVRKGSEFKDVGVLICDSEGSDLSKRRDLRRQRRTLRSKKFRRQWFSKELVKLGLPKPQTALDDPISLRVRALNGEKLKPEELHAALTHLFKRRGYSKVPWANVEKVAKEKKDDDEGIIKEKVKAMQAELGDKHPCQLLAERRTEAGKSPTENWARKIYWPREVLQKEFLAIAGAQKKNFQKLAEKADWLLYGDSQSKEMNGETFHVFFKTTEARNPGVLGLRWPRFDNRGPALDSLQPVDEQGRPMHVVRKNKEAFGLAQWELALMNFRVLDFKTRQKRDPRTDFPIFIENVRNEWNKKGKVTEARLKKLAEPFKDQFLLIEDQKPLTPETGAGRARYSSPTLELIRKEIGEGRQVDPPQPILRRKGENAEQALNRYLADIKHPTVRHRLALFRGILTQLVKDYGQPDMIVLEAVRSLALGQKAKNELNKRNEQFRKERENARENLSSNNESFSKKAIQRYRLWQEAKGRCPFCLQTIERTDLGHGADIEHLVPRSIVDCNEFYNLTVAHMKCNRELKGDRTPLAAFGGTSQWEGIKVNAENCFSGRKLEIFLSPNAEELIEQKSDLQHTAYIARVIRHISLVQLGCAITLPYYRATNTELLRRQIEWTSEWKTAMWRQIITAKVRNQAANLAHLKRAHTVLTGIANRCEKPNPIVADEKKPSLATLTATKRAAFLSDSPEASESRAARHYWKHLLPRLSEWQQTDEKNRVPGTREGVNGMLDYGYAILRTAVLRSLAAHGFIAAIGIAHTPKAGSFALADDVMEPLRPWIDRELKVFLQGGPRPMPEWMRQAVSVLQLEVAINRNKMRLLNAIDVYVQSFADAALSRRPTLLKIPMLP